MRCFVGLPVPWEAADLLSRRAGSIGAGRAVAADDLHLTLAFLDDQPQASLAALHEELEGLSAPAVTLRWGASEFLGGDRTRVFALSVEAEPGLMHLQGRVRAAVRAAGIVLPHDRFRPHVTLIRLPRGIDPAAQERLQGLIARGPAAGLSPVTIDRLLLYGSHLSRDGAWYEELAEYHLGPAVSNFGTGRR